MANSAFPQKFAMLKNAELLDSPRSRLDTGAHLCYPALRKADEELRTILAIERPEPFCFGNKDQEGQTMGHRANYVLIEQSEPEIYYSHWGSKSIPEMLLAGPERAWIYIQHLTPSDTLMNNIWAEGGVLMDRDHHRLIFWGGEEIKYAPYLRRYFLPVLRQLWPEWTIEWALHGVADLADALHIDRAAVLAGEFEEGFDPDYPVADDVLLECEYNTTFITVRWKDGAVCDYRLQCLPGTILSHSPRLLEILPGKAPDPLPHERNEYLDGGAFFDLTSKEIWVWNIVTLDPRYLAALEQLWAEWRVIGHVDGIARQVALSGRDPSPIMVPEDKAVAELVKALTMEGLRMPSPGTLMAALTTSVPEGTQAQVAPGFFTAPGQIISAEERRQILQRLFHLPG